MTDAKICGITTPEALTAAADGGARFVGFVFYAKSPRNVDIETARYLAGYAPADMRKVGLFVDPEDGDLEAVLNAAALDMIQLHGAESEGRVLEVKKRFGLPVIKAIAVATKDDLAHVPGYEAAADWLLFDAKPENMPGGGGKVFDWRLLEGLAPTRPWMLAGGLSQGNVAEAIAALEPDAVDVSSGVESAPGVKDPAKIRAFLEAVKQA